jgi:hypothetical protein
MLAVVIELYLYELHFELYWCAQTLIGEQQMLVTLNLNNVWKLEAICIVTEEQQTPLDEFKYDLHAVYHTQCV